MKLKSKIRKYGNGYYVYIPKLIMDSFEYDKKEMIANYEENKIVLTVKQES